MPLDPNLNFNFSEPQQQAINDAFDALLAVLSDSTTPYVNLTKEERKFPSIGPKRMPYVHDAVDNIIPVFPNLASGSIPLARTTTLLDLIMFIQSVKPKMDEVIDRLIDLGINAENLVYKSMGDSYDLALRQEGRMPGADVLIAAIAPLFANQGKRKVGPEPIPGDDDANTNGPTPPESEPGDNNFTP